MNSSGRDGSPSRPVEDGPWKPAPSASAPYRSESGPCRDPLTCETEGCTHRQSNGQVKITTKFVEIGGGTEELGFDWVVEDGEGERNVAPLQPSR